MSISIDEENTFDKIQHACMIKGSENVRLKGTYLDVTKAAYRSQQATSSFVGKGLKPNNGSDEQDRMDTNCPILFSLVLEVLTGAIRQEMEIKGIQTGKE